MAKIKGGTKGGVNDSLFREEIGRIIKTGDGGRVADIVEFTKAPWGLNLQATPVQTFMLKTIYGMPLDDKIPVVDVPDTMNSKILYPGLTEMEFAKWSYEEGRCNIDFSDPNNWDSSYYNFVFALGRRSGKCRKSADLINTTIGSITFDELLQRKNKNENIGILTYDFTTLKQNTTSDFKIWSNGIKECFEIKTNTGFLENSTGNHPYLILNNNECAKFIDLSEIKVGDRIAIPKKNALFGVESIGVDKARMFGVLYKNNKEIPKEIHKGSKDEIVEFLSSLFFCSGSIITNKKEKLIIGMEFDFSFYKMAYEIKCLLLKLGVHSELKENVKNNLFIVNILNKHIKTFIEEIKIFEESEFEVEKKDDGLIIDELDSDVYWDTVKSIKSVGNHKTVDLCVEDTHIIGGELISHNSTLCSCIVDYEFYRLFKMGNPHEYYNVPAGQEIAVIGTAPTDGQAQIVFNMAKTFAQNSPIIKDRVAHPTQTYFEIQTNADVKNYGKGRDGSMQFITGGSSSNAIRGHNAIVILVDEMAFFNENGGRFSIDEVYGALTPSIAKFKNPETGSMDGKVICLSSPYAHFGKFFDLYRDSFSEESQKSGKTVSYRYYTALVNPGNAPEEYLKEEKRKDRSKFRREFEAEFDERITAWIDSEVQFRNNIRRPYELQSGKRGIKYFYGFDFGSTDNGAGISIVHKENDRYSLDYSEVFYPKNSPIWEATVCTMYKEHSLCAKFRQYDVLPFFEIGDLIKDLVRKFPMFQGVLDQYSGHAIFQILQSKGIDNVDLRSYNESSKSRIFKLIKELYQENLLDLMDHPVLIQEMLNMEAELRPGNKVSVNKRSASDESFQDDITDSYVRAVWECWRYYNVDNKGSKKKAPAMLSFGNGRSFGGENSNEFDLSRKLRTVSSFREMTKIKNQLHGIDTKRNGKERKFK